MKKTFKRFDMQKKPKSIRGIFKPLANLVFKSSCKKHKTIIHYEGTENLKGPFLFLGNHNAYYDLSVACKVLKKLQAHFVAAIDGFIGREWVLRRIGCICKRKFTNDVQVIKHLKYAVDKGHVAAIYPEARYSLCGTTAVLPRALGKLVKLLKVPVATLVCNGHHINSPFWDTSHDRGVKPTEATYKLLMTRDDVEKLSVDEINEKIVNELQYDDFKWQKDNNVIINDPKRAEGLHRVLYQCPHCKKEFEMASSGSRLICNACGKEWEMTELGELKAIDGKDVFTHIPDWYEWERENVRKEVETGTYSSGVLNVNVKSLPNAKKFINLGKGTLIHDMNGFIVEGIDVDGDAFKMVKPVESLYSCHVEYQYLFKHGDCIDLNTLDDTWYIYPEGHNFSVTKMALATEELYLNQQRKKNIPILKGLA